jgi:prepilin-type N-terminal cleavage/methylation domain-containing protein
MKTSKTGFTLIELLVVISVISILAALLLPALSSAKAKAQRAKCQSNERQLQLALQMYVDELGNRIPARTDLSGDWVTELRPYYANRSLLVCPVDGGTNRGYVMNGFLDYFVVNMFSGDLNQFIAAYKGDGFPSLPEASVVLPSDTITVGEQRHGSKKDAYMDLWPPQYGSDLVDDVDHAKHRSGSGRRSGGSNHAFMDGSVRFLKYGAAVSPKNLWAVTDEFRNVPVSTP